MCLCYSVTFKYLKGDSKLLTYVFKSPYNMNSMTV